MKVLRRTTRDLLTAMTLAAGSMAAAHAQAVASYACGPLTTTGQFGPYDYRTIDAGTKHKVEDYHFPAQVEQLRAGGAGPIGGDIDYTLRAFPNNPRALLAMSRYSTKLHREQVPAARYTTECYFDRAMRFAPDDPMPHVLYANYLKERKRTADARTQLDEAERLRGDPSNFDFDYNLGLLYYELGEYDKSAVAAKRAYALGAPLPALMDKLKKAGKWRD